MPPAVRAVLSGCARRVLSASVPNGCKRIGPEWLQENTGDVPAELGEFDSLPRLRVRVTDKDGRTLSGKWVFAMLPLMGGYRISDYQVGDYFRQCTTGNGRARAHEGITAARLS